MPDTQNPPLYWKDTEEMSRKSAVILREVLIGKTNNTIQVTLAPNATSTRIEKERVCCDTVVNLMPKTASAATALASGSLYVELNKGSITIHHDSTADTDRTFGAVLTG